MTEDGKSTRVVRVYAKELAVGDTLIDPYGAYMGTVETPPQMTRDKYVTAMVVRAGDGRTTERRWRAETVMRIEIPRRTS